MRAIGLHRDVVVITSRIWQTTCTLLRGGEEAFSIDSPVLPDELELVPAVAQQSKFEVVGLLATHADWDHLLGQYAFPEAPLGCAPSTAEALRARPGEAQRKLREFDDEFYLERPGPLRLPAPQELPTPGRCSIGDSELELHPATGHTGDGLAVLAEWARVLVCGDYLSPVGIPIISETGSLESYLETLDRLEALVAQADWVVPGHGQPLDSQRAAAILREDRAYVRALAREGERATLPLARRTPAQRRLHERNVVRTAGERERSS